MASKVTPAAKEERAKVEGAEKEGGAAEEAGASSPSMAVSIKIGPRFVEQNQCWWHP